MNIVELLSLRGLDTTAKIKLVRHQDKRYDFRELVRKGVFDLYQSYQHKPVFECDSIVSFLGMERANACFYGVYRVQGRKAVADKPLPDNFEYPDFVSPEGLLRGAPAPHTRIVVGQMTKLPA
ncbi:MAG: hypothetical protein JW934_12665 [Anaerolineae bacterium]|nr:hypothetical protein [Anaerolineae bacterium]